jgi:hypothetical protein
MSKVSNMMTPAETEIIKEILTGTWEYIGNDIMDALQAEGKNRISKSDLAEVVLDADYPKMMVERLKAQAVWEKFCNNSYRDRLSFIKEKVFTQMWYS